MEESGVSPWFWALCAVALAYLSASPGVLQGFWDTYIYAPFLGLTQPQLKRDDIRMGAKLAEGGFGQVFLAEAKADVPGRVEKGEVRAFPQHLLLCRASGGTPRQRPRSSCWVIVQSWRAQDRSCHMSGQTSTHKCRQRHIKSCLPGVSSLHLMKLTAEARSEAR